MQREHAAVLRRWGQSRGIPAGDLLGHMCVGDNTNTRQCFTRTAMSAYGSQSYPAPESYRDSGEGWGEHAAYPQSYDEHSAYPQPYGEEYATHSQTHGEAQAASAWAIQSDDEEEEAELDSDDGAHPYLPRLGRLPRL